MLDIFISSAPLFLSGVFLFGLLIGSFLNVVILRVPARLEYEWQCQCKDLLEIKDEIAAVKPPGIVISRSECPNCGHQITALENIPVISYLFLRGKCSSCKTRISLRYPFVELGTALLFLLAAMHFGPTIQTIAALGFTGMLVALAGIDIDHQLLPDDLTFVLLWAGLFASLFGVFVDPVNSIIGALAGYLSLWSIYHVFRLLTGKEGMGYGDFKLMAAMGAWMGWEMLPLIILLASLVGAVVGLALIAINRHKRSQPMPFGPYIAASGWIALLWGDQIINAYLHSSGLA